MPVIAALPSRETAVPRRRTNQRVTTALATTGPTAASPRDGEHAVDQRELPEVGAESGQRQRDREQHRAGRGDEPGAEAVGEAADPGHEETVEERG